MNHVAPIQSSNLAQARGQAEGVDHKKVLELLQENRGRHTQDFLAEHREDLNYNELALFLHLKYLLNDSWKSVATYARSVADFLNYVARPFDQVQHYQAEDYVEMLKTSGYMANTVNLRVAAVRSFYTFLTKHNYMTYSPAAGLKKLRRAKGRFTEHVLSHEDKDRLLQYARDNACPRDFLLVAFLYATGARVSEAIRITWGDLYRDVRGRWWVLIEGKGGKERDVYIPGQVMDYLMQYRQIQFCIAPYARAPALNGMPVFSHIRNTTESLTPQTVFRIVQRIGRESIGMEVSPHWLRHTHSTHARLRNAPLEDIMRQLGHASYNTTLRYDQSSHLRDPAGEYLEEELSSAFSD